MRRRPNLLPRSHHRRRVIRHSRQSETAARMWEDRPAARLAAWKSQAGQSQVLCRGGHVGSRPIQNCPPACPSDHQDSQLCSCHPTWGSASASPALTRHPTWGSATASPALTRAGRAVELHLPAATRTVSPVSAACPHGPCQSCSVAKSDSVSGGPMPQRGAVQTHVKVVPQVQGSHQQ